MTLPVLAGRAVASLPAGLRWRTRNAIALVRWMRLRLGGDSDGAAYDDGFWSFHATGDWHGLADAVLQYCVPQSIVDVGCGDGKLLSALRAQSPTIALLGIDGSRRALARVAAAGLPVHFHDLSSTRSRDLAALRADVSGFDVAVSLETAEHLPPWTSPGFVETLSRARMVVFSAAQPGQGGTLHMNERPAAYWQTKFEACGFRVGGSDAAFRKAVSGLDLPWWYSQNIHVFERVG
jgi:SAM-dependent methyltransferase